MIKKIIPILILSLITLVFAQPALAGDIANCQECCKGISDTNPTDGIIPSGICTNACNQTTGTALENMQACQTDCQKGITKDNIAQSQCVACCNSLGYSYGSPITSYTQVSNLIISITRWFAGIVFAIAVIMIIYGGVLYITAAGDSEKAKKARSLLLYACIGIAVAILAFGAQFLIQSFLESGKTIP